MPKQLDAKQTDSELPLQLGYEWVGNRVTKKISRYRWTLMVESFVVSAPRLGLGVKIDIVLAERCCC